MELSRTRQRTASNLLLLLKLKSLYRLLRWLQQSLLWCAQLSKQSKCVFKYREASGYVAYSNCFSWLTELRRYCLYSAKCKAAKYNSTLLHGHLSCTEDGVILTLENLYLKKPKLFSTWCYKPEMFLFMAAIGLTLTIHILNTNDLHLEQKLQRYRSRETCLLVSLNAIKRHLIW